MVLRPTYIRKIIKHDKTKHYFLSIGRIIPKNWDYVLIKVLSKKKDRILLELRKTDGKIINVSEVE